MSSQRHGSTAEGLIARPHVPSHIVPKIIKVYPYTDESGALLFQVVRYEPKGFRQRRRDGHGNWIWNLHDTRRVPYQLPNLIKAVASGQTIYIPEGEKDVESLRAIGLAATTNPGGTNKWRDEYSGYLHGADVVVLPDNHAGGREHAEQIVTSLRSIAKRVRILDIGKHWAECPDKGDISDWLAGGGTAEKLRAIASTLPEVSATADTHSSAAEPTLVANVALVAWPTMADAAYHGVAGEIVNTIKPHTEADPVAILIQLLTCAGNIIGNGPYYQIEGTRHHANLFSVLVGQSSKARKGTALDRISSIIRVVEDRWYSERVKGGLSSGEGFIDPVRDEIKKWNVKEGSWEIVDPGVSDKRLLVIEPELASVFMHSERQGNSLSPLMRKAWDGGILATMTRSNPLRATGAHISVVGHITVEELRAKLVRTEMANGFANRFLFMLVKRANVLPFGSDALSDEVIAGLGEKLKTAIDVARELGRVGWTSDAAESWKKVYPHLSAEQPGLLGAVTARGEAQCVRLALLYTLLDGKVNIEVPHLDAALAVWDYAETSAAHIFGSSLGDNVADDIFRSLQHAGRIGMTRSAIRDLFSRHQSADRIGAALALLASKGRATMEIRQSGGRPTEIWTATESRQHG